jgi:uncharacterized Zn finger protein (UPF0148 family)
VEADYDKPWFEQDENGEWKCLLCGSYATEGHLASDKHRQRSAHPEWYGYAQESGGTLSSAVTSQSPWLDATCGSCSSAGGYYATLYDKPWFEKKDGEWYCNLCGNWATEEHINSNRHRSRAETPEYYGFAYPNAQDPQQQPAANGLPPGWTSHWSEEYKSEYYHHEDTGETTWEKPGGAAVSAGALVPYHYKSPEYNFPWFERKDHGEYYCNLCHNWATDGHIASDKHRKRAEYPEWYGFANPSTPGSSDAVPQLVAATSTASASSRAAGERRETESAPQPKVPKPWVAYWDEEHRAYYFHNPDTGVTSWEKPVDFAD